MSQPTRLALLVFLTLLFVVSGAAAHAQEGAAGDAPASIDEILRRAPAAT